MDGLSFNSNPPKIMHIDLNSCFATIEQQANPRLRGHPIAVAAYATPRGCILAPSIEAKRWGVKTGMRVMDGKALCPSLLVLPPDPWKYRAVHLKLRALLAQYTNTLSPKSIDEFVLDLSDRIAVSGTMESTAREIKNRIKAEIGDWLTVSIGISTNRYLAKLASGLEKPDGLTEINCQNHLSIYEKLPLTDLPYIKTRNAARLATEGIFSTLDFYKADTKSLTRAFHSINGYYWYLRLRGHEIDAIPWGRRSYGNSYALPRPYTNSKDIYPILSKLVTKTAFRMRKAGYKAHGVHIFVGYRDGSAWHKGRKTESEIFETTKIYREIFRLFADSPKGRPIRELAVSVFELSKDKSLQLSLFSDRSREARLARSIDDANDRWGTFVVTPGRMLKARGDVPDRIAFGGVKELEEFTLGS